MAEGADNRTVHGKPLFTFALVADTHVQSPDDKPSPWKTNNLAAERARRCYEQVAESKPSFIVHLGDVTNPVPHAPTFESACIAAKKLVAIAEPITTHVVAGNHDVGDKLSRIVPNHPIDEYSIQKFGQFWGPSWKSWDFEDVHFLIINSSLIGANLPQEKEQFDFIKADLRANAEKRIFIFTHYPLFMENPTEVSLYDNIEPDGRAALLQLLQEYNVEAAIAGHVHNFFYNKYGNTEMYGLLSTTFVRHDYAEMFATAPADEYGRNDTPKLGWAQITIYESGHVLKTHRLLDPIHSTSKAKSLELHPKMDNRSALGVNLRDAWAQAKPLMYYGPVDEFERRKVRNDYLLLALWESGIRHLRVPLRDLLDKEYVDRMKAMVAIGHTFTAFVVDVPTEGGDLFQCLKDNEGLLSGLEIILPWQDIEAEYPKIENLTQSVAVQIYLACISAAIDHRKKPYQFAYFMSYGFYADEVPMLTDIHDRIGRRLGLGYAFRIGPNESPVTSGSSIVREFVEKENVPVTFNIASLSTIPQLRDDETATVTRSTEAAMLAMLDTNSKTKVFLETLIDVQKGYNPSIGLYDALYNPRVGAQVVANLQAVISPTLASLMSIEVYSCEQQVKEYRIVSDGTSRHILAPESEEATNVYRAKVKESAGALSLATLKEASEETTGTSPVII